MPNGSQPYQYPYPPPYGYPYAVPGLAGLMGGGGGVPSPQEVHFQNLQQQLEQTQDPKEQAALRQQMEDYAQQAQQQIQQQQNRVNRGDIVQGVLGGLAGLLEGGPRNQFGQRSWASALGSGLAGGLGGFNQAAYQRAQEQAALGRMAIGMGNLQQRSQQNLPLKLMPDVQQGYLSQVQQYINDPVVGGQARYTQGLIRAGDISANRAQILLSQLSGGLAQGGAARQEQVAAGGTMGMAPNVPAAGAPPTVSPAGAPSPGSYGFKGGTAAEEAGLKNDLRSILAKRGIKGATADAIINDMIGTPASATPASVTAAPIDGAGATVAPDAGSRIMTPREYAASRGYEPGTDPRLMEKDYEDYVKREQAIREKKAEVPIEKEKEKLNFSFEERANPITGMTERFRVGLDPTTGAKKSETRVGYAFTADQKNQLFQAGQALNTIPDGVAAAHKVIIDMAGLTPQQQRAKIQKEYNAYNVARQISSMEPYDPRRIALARYYGEPNPDFAQYFTMMGQLQQQVSAPMHIFRAMGLFNRIAPHIPEPQDLPDVNLGRLNQLQKRFGGVLRQATEEGEATAPATAPAATPPPPPGFD